MASSLGGQKKFQNDITFLLVSTKQEVPGDRKCGLSTIWVNTCQARVCFMEDVVRELTAWVSSGPDWPYVLVQLNEDTHHVPLPKEGHLSILPEGGTNMTTWGRISQLEVCQLLASGLQVAYLVGLNGNEDPIITSLPKSLTNGISITGGGSIYLELNIPHPMAEELDRKASPLGRLSSILIASPLKTTPPKPERYVSMTMEVRSLLSMAMLDTFVAGQGTSPQKDQTLWLYSHLHPTSWEISPRSVDTSSLVSAPNNLEMAEASLEEVPTTISPIAKTPESRSITPPTHVGQLWEKANKALEELLALSHPSMPIGRM